MNAQLTILSPVHIGNGKTISPVEYEINHDKYAKIDMNAFFQDSSADMNQYYTAIEDYKNYGKFPFQFQKKHYQYTTPVGEYVDDEIIGKEIRSFMKTTGNVYIPGSTIKGALRTAMLYNVLKNDTNQYQKAVTILQQQISQRYANPSQVAAAIEKQVFGDTTHDFFKALQISDTQPMSPEDVLTLQIIDILSSTSSNKMYTKFSLLAECLKQHTTFLFNWKTDNYYFSSAAKELGFSDKKELLTETSSICNDYADELIDYEYNFFKRFGDQFQDMLDFYEDLIDLRYADNFNGFLLRLGYGSGWQTMTMGRLFEDEPLFQKLRQKFRLGKRGIDLFPKSRRIIADKKDYPFGWVHVQVES